VLVMQAWRVDAAPGDTDSTFVPTAGCRVTDTRSTSTVGPRNTPLGDDESFTVTIHGGNGECTGVLAIPTDAVGVAVNVTAVNATASSNIRVFPADLAEVPLLSNLNVSAGAPPTPNKVDVKLSPDGKVKVYNFNGSVNIVIDVVGYYTNASLQELSQRVVALEAAQATNTSAIAVLEAAQATNTSAIAVLEAAQATNTSAIAVLDAAQPFAVTARDSSVVVTATDEVVVSVAVTAPVAGRVTVNSTSNAFDSDAGGQVRCSIIAQESMVPIDLDFNYLQQWESPGADGSYAQLAGTRTFEIVAGVTVTYSLVCDHAETSPTSELFDSVLTAIFTPTP